MGIGAYITYTLNLWGPMARMANAASQQALEVGKERLREFLESSDTGRQAMAMSGRQGGRQYDEISMDTLNSDGKKKARNDDDDLDDL
jgi:protein SEY1